MELTLHWADGKEEVVTSEGIDGQIPDMVKMYHCAHYPGGIEAFKADGEPGDFTIFDEDDGQYYEREDD